MGGGERKYHVVITAQGTAVHWQSRVHFYWYRKARPCSAAALAAGLTRDTRGDCLCRMVHTIGVTRYDP